jgi:hypothetical protein
MSRHGYLVWVVSLGLVACIMLGCGAGQIQSLTISPASANAQSYPAGGDRPRVVVACRNEGNLGIELVFFD